jgi:hypothetical protein
VLGAEAVKSVTISLALLLLSPTWAYADSVGAKLAVMPLTASGITPEKTRLLDDLLTTQLYERGHGGVMSAADINAVLGLEKMKDVAGCSDVSCLAEVGGALGVDTNVAGSVGKLAGEL